MIEIAQIGIEIEIAIGIGIEIGIEIDVDPAHLVIEKENAHVPHDRALDQENGMVRRTMP